MKNSFRFCSGKNSGFEPSPTTVKNFLAKPYTTVTLLKVIRAILSES